MINLNLKYEALINKLGEELSFSPDLTLILGSGLGDFVDEVKLLKTFVTSSLPGYPHSTIEGHEGKIHFAEFAGKKVLIFQGRIHLYEGYHISECILPVFIAHKLNSKNLLLTNAAGGINRCLQPGDLMFAESFNGIMIKKELTDLIGLSSLEGKKNIFNFPSASLNKIIKEAALDEEINLKEGVYWYTKGPSYETPAEIKMISKFGGDAVGMSTVHEAVFSSYLGMETASISCITNFAAGISEAKLNHAEVTETANRVKDKFHRLVKRIINLL
jgi:purine-nucleoside phosphorylase